MCYRGLDRALAAAGEKPVAGLVVVVAVTTAAMAVATMVLAAVVPIEQAIKNAHAPNSPFLNALETNAAALLPDG